jgi:8-oxo-dGTP pyrophosphatase MutT (NUDIX family)
MPRKNKIPGAGLILFRTFEGEEKVLVLLKDNGSFDIPKGHQDSRDLDKFSTAQRECFEETQIFIAPADLLCDDHYTNFEMTVFCARTKQDPIIEKNPETGKLEHVDFYWMKPESAIKVLPDYLSDAVKWSLKYTVNT